MGEDREGGAETGMAEDLGLFLEPLLICMGVRGNWRIFWCCFLVDLGVIIFGTLS